MGSWGGRTWEGQLNLAPREARERGGGRCKNREESMAVLLHCEPTTSAAPAATEASLLCSFLYCSSEKYSSKSFSTDLLISFCQLTGWLLNHWEDLTPSCESAQREEQSSWPQQMIDIYLPACQGPAISSRQKYTPELMRVTSNPVAGKKCRCLQWE